MGEGQTTEGTGQSQEQGLEKQLASEAQAASSQGQLQGERGRARHAPRQLQASEVDRGQSHEHRGQDEEGAQVGGETGGGVFTVGDESRTPVTVRVGEALGQGLCNAIEFGLSGFQAAALGQEAESLGPA